MLTAVAPILAPILKPALDRVLDRVIPDEAARRQASAEIDAALRATEAQVMETAASVVRTEMEGDKLQRSWRPALMYFLMFLIAWLAIVAPAFGVADASLAALERVPDHLWNLLMIGMGGYIVGRSAEKVVGGLRK